MISQCIKIFSRRNNFLTLVIGSFVLFVTLRIIPIFTVLKNSYRIPNISAQRKIDLFIEYIFETFAVLPLSEQFLIIILSIATMMNIILFVIFAKKQRTILSKRSFAASVSGMVLGLFGVGCISCGFLILAPLLTVLGLGGYIIGISKYALLLSYIGLALVAVSIMYLLKKLSEPMVCTP